MGSAEGVAGPLVRAAQISCRVPLARVRWPRSPEGAGGEGDAEDRGGVTYGSHSLAQLKDACRAKGLPVGGTKAALRARPEAAA